MGEGRYLAICQGREELIERRFEMQIEVGKKYVCKDTSVKFIYVADYGVKFRVEMDIGKSYTLQGLYNSSGELCYIYDMYNDLQGITKDLDIVAEYDPGTAFKAIDDILDGKHPDVSTQCSHEFTNQSLSEADPVWACKHCGKSKDECETLTARAKHITDTQKTTHGLASINPFTWPDQNDQDDNTFGQCDDDD